MLKKERPTIGQLNEGPRFRMIKKLDHNEIVHFVIEQIKHPGWPMVLFWIISSLLLLAVITLTIFNYFNPVISWGNWLLYLGLGVFTGMILVIPVHEGLHGLAYRIAGAERVEYGMDLSQMIFYASAPGFVAGRRDFMMVAFLPFTLINLVFVAAIILSPPALQWASLVALFVHSTLCIGDFAMAGFYAGFPGKEIFTYDDELTKQSYFFIENE